MTATMTQNRCRHDLPLGSCARCRDEQSVGSQFSHYHRACPFPSVDVYRVLLLFGVTDPCLQHALKKVLCAGGRGAKDAEKDVREAIASLQRWLEMRKEEGEFPLKDGGEPPLGAP